MRRHVGMRVATQGRLCERGCGQSSLRTIISIKRIAPVWSNTNERSFCTEAQPTAKSRLPRGFWNDPSNQRQALEKIGKDLGVTELSDWYRITRKQIKDKGGRCLFLYNTSLESLLKRLYPEYPWLSSKFQEEGSTPQGYWDDVNVQREWLDKIGAQVGVKMWTDWYSVTRKQIEQRGGKGMFRRKPLKDILMAAYPAFPWQEEQFIEIGKTPAGYWQQKENLFKALEKAEKALGVQQPEDWYSIRMSDILEVGFPSGVSKAQLAELLQEKYPTHKFEKVLLLKGRFAQQKRLENAIFALFPNKEVTVNARKEADLVNPDTGDFMELDVYIPSLKLAFEYQEQHHYVSTEYSYKTLKELQNLDTKKLELARVKGITVIVVPCWWDGRQESLVATIKKVRPELLRDVDYDNAAPISEEPPPHFFDKHTDTVVDIGQPTTACFLTKTHSDPSNWWLFEKYDGVRAFWNPLKKKFYSRHGKEFLFPQEVVDAMPSDTFLDGELWFGRENFQEAMKIAYRMDPSTIDWKNFKYMVFDMPSLNENYEARYTALENSLKDKDAKFIELAPRIVCKDTTHLEEVFQDIVDQGGEGIILRDPKAPYQPGRSQGYLKHKKFRDAEAKIIGPAGSLQWECQLPNGIRFVAVAATTEFAKRWNPKPGDIVSFKHHGFLLATKKPKLPTLYRIRNELNWDDVVRNWKEQKATTPTAWPLRRPQTKNRPKGYWKDIENRKKFFIELAEEMGFDYTDGESWQRVTHAKIFIKKGKGLLGLYNNSLKDALDNTFPELDYRAKQQKKGYWRDVANRRKAFEDFAKEMGFDPLNERSWLNVSAAQFIAKKGRGPLLPFGNSLRNALQQTFPEFNETGNQTMSAG